MSLSCPVKVCLQSRSRTSQSYKHGEDHVILLVASTQRPAYFGCSITGTRNEGVSIRSHRNAHHITGVPTKWSYLLTALNVPQCTVNYTIFLLMPTTNAITCQQLLSFQIMHTILSYQVISPELVKILVSSKNRQLDKYPVWPCSSRLTRTFPSRVFKL